jgi:hypothetical protein
VIVADWRWWTYFLIDGHCVTRGCIVSYDLATRSLTYTRRNNNPVDKNPYALGTTEYSSWCWDTVSGIYDEIWVDPARAIVLSREEFDLLEAGRRPRSFEMLKDVDPQAFFAEEKQVIASYLPRLPGES